MSVDKRNLARRVTLFLILCLMLGSFVPGWQAAAQDSTPTNEEPPAEEIEEEQPAADPTEAQIEVPTEVPTEEPTTVPTEIAELTPTTEQSETIEPTIEDVPEIFINSDTIESLSESSIQLDPGVWVTVSFYYFVTTPRVSTLVTASLVDDSGTPAQGWSVNVDGVGDGTSTAVFENGATVSAGAGFEFTIKITAPAVVASDHSMRLHLGSVAVLQGDVTEVGVADAGPLFTATVIAPPAVQVNADTLFLQTEQPSTITESIDGVYQTKLTYSVTTDRASTTLQTSLIDSNTGVAAVGWVVLVNGVTGSYTDSQTITTGSAFEVIVEISRDESAGITEAVATSLILQISATSTATPDESGIATPATATVGISVPALGGFEASNVVNNNSARQNCTNDGGSTVALDSVAPFEVIEFDCDFFPTGLGAVTGVITTTATLILAPGWTIAAVPGSETVLGLPVLGSETAYTSPSVVFTSVAVLPLNGPSSFKVRLKAPGAPLTEQTGSNVVTATVTSSCQVIVVVATACGNSVSTLGVTVDLTDVSSSGGALIGVEVLGLAPGTLLMDLQCDPPVSYTIAPGGTYQANCSIGTTAAANALGVLTLDGTLIGTSSNGWQVGYADGHNATIGTGILNLDLGLIAASVLNGYEFTVFLTAPGCGTISGDPINAIEIRGSYTLAVGPIALPLSDGIAVLPFQIDGSASTSLPSAAAGGGLDFGQYEWDGSAFQPVGGAGSASLSVTISEPASGCVSPGWTLNITANTSMSGSNGGSVAAADISYSGVTSSASGVTLNNPGSPIALGNVGATPVTVLTGTDATFAVPTSITATAGFTLAPPSSNQVLGTYTGSITVETSVAP